LRIVCGWNASSRIPSESKFSRAFKEFTAITLPERVHTALITKAYEGEIVGHVSIDSNPIAVRESS